MNILLSYDGQPWSQKALDFAADHAKALNQPLNIITIVTRKSTDQSAEIEQAERRLEKAKIHCQDLNLPCKTKMMISPSDVGEALVAYAKEQSVDILIVGIRRTSRVGKLLLGSNAQYVILNAHCPVLSVGKG